MTDLITRLRDTCDCGVVDEVIAELERLREALSSTVVALEAENPLAWPRVLEKAHRLLEDGK